VSEALRSILLGTAGLGVAAALAVFLTWMRGPVRADAAALRAAARVAVVALCAQLAHFAEELATGFPRRFPAELGLAPWPQGFFVAFNLFWLAVWAWSARALLTRRQPAVAALWFLAIAGMVNAVAHPVLSLRVVGYFPGLVTSPWVGVAGVVLARRLAALTR
jgi:hypothetical protein